MTDAAASFAFICLGIVQMDKFSTIAIEMWLMKRQANDQNAKCKKCYMHVITISLMVGAIICFGIVVYLLSIIAYEEYGKPEYEKTTNRAHDFWRYSAGSFYLILTISLISSTSFMNNMLK